MAPDAPHPIPDAPSLNSESPLVGTSPPGRPSRGGPSNQPVRLSVRRLFASAAWSF